MNLTTWMFKLINDLYGDSEQLLWISWIHHQKKSLKQIVQADVRVLWLEWYFYGFDALTP